MRLEAIYPIYLQVQVRDTDFIGKMDQVFCDVSRLRLIR